MIFRFIKFFEIFQNCRGTQIFGFLETSMGQDFLDTKIDELEREKHFQDFFRKIGFFNYYNFSEPF